MGGFREWTERSNTLCYLAIRASLMGDEPRLVAVRSQSSFERVTDAMMRTEIGDLDGVSVSEGTSLRFSKPGGIVDRLTHEAGKGFLV
jgi:hypothetical protein